MVFKEYKEKQASKVFKAYRVCKAQRVTQETQVPRETLELQAHLVQTEMMDYLHISCRSEWFCWNRGSMAGFIGWA
jgi:hypothetical protein